MDDLREMAIELANRLKSEAEEFPIGSPGRRTLLQAVRKIKIHYIWGLPQKKQMIFQKIQAGNRKIAELQRVTCLSRPELEQILDTMVAEGLLLESKEQPDGAKPGGRPFRFFRPAR